MAAGGSAALFAQGVRAVLGGWAALQVAVTHGFGGPHGPEKVTWLGGALQDFFQHNEGLQQDEVEQFLAELLGGHWGDTEGLQQDEVEQFLAEILDQEFDTIVEDGSLEQVSRQLLELHSRARGGDAVAVGAAVAALARGGPALQALVAATRPGGGTPGGGGDSDSGDSDDDDTGDTSATSETSAAQQPPHPEGRGDTAEDMDVSPPPDPGGWTLVQRRRR